MRVLHICNDFCGSKVHRNLTRILDEKGIIQTVYCPVREVRLMGKNQFEGRHIRFIYSYCIKSWYKYFYFFKLKMLYSDMKRRIDFCQFDIIQAPTLFSDGGLALKLHKDYGIPYIVSVRNTDINLYIRRLRHTHRYGREILLHASRIIFISKGEMSEFEESDFARTIYDNIKNKIILQPNGIEKYWHQHITTKRRTGKDVLYIGDFTLNKNVTRLAKAVLKLKSTGINDVHLILVGGEKEEKTEKNDEYIQQLICKNPEVLINLGRIYDKDQLLKVMSSSALFAMPSIYETFGLVYIEALSQNLPVIYTRGQGIDGFFDDNVGIGVDALSVDAIYNAIKQVLTNPEKYSNKTVDFSMFDWDKIADRYISMYGIINESIYQ